LIQPNPGAVTSSGM
jgi:hypothetical protein